MGFLNIFKKTETEPQAISVDRQNIENQEEDLGNTAAIDEQRNWAQRLDDVKQYIKEAENIGLSVKPEDIERIMKTDYEELIQYASGGQEFAEKDLNDIHETISQILRENEDQYEDKGIKSWLRSRAVKISFATLMLFLKFAPQVQAHEAPVDKQGEHPAKIENNDIKSAKNTPNTNENTYQLKAEDLGDNSMENSAMLDLTNSYETDKDIISDQDAEKIRAKLHTFLDKINPSNYEKIGDLSFKIYGSSDERPTNAWKGGNLELTQARIAAAEKIICAELESYDFSKSGLNEEQIQNLLSKKFQHGIPEHGETHITDLLNPETGQNYTDKEVSEMKKNNQTKYHDLLRECRYIKVNLLAKADELKPMPTIHPALETGSKETVTERAVDLISEYDQTVIIFDNSPSMVDSKNYMGDQLQSIDRNGDIKIASFSDQLDFITATDNFQQAGGVLKSIENKGGNHEKAIYSAIEALNGFNNSPEKSMDDKLLLINTDEAIQTTKAEMDELVSKSQTNGVKVYFLLGYDRNHQILKVSLEEMEKNFTNIYDKKLSAIEGRIEKAKVQLARDNITPKSEETYTKMLEKAEKDLTKLSKVKIYVENFSLPEDPNNPSSPEERLITMNIYD